MSAGTLVGVSAGSVAQGRLIDRVGPTRPLLVAAALLMLASGALIAAVEAGRTLPVLVGLALLTGLVQPALPGASRALWGVLLAPGRRRDAAYSYEAISLEVFFILGPAGRSSAGVAVELAGPTSAFLVGGVAGGVVAALLWCRRDTLAPAPRGHSGVALLR